jgi:23S rRNA (cytosine1962-C5)-methyltransferase
MQRDARPVLRLSPGQGRRLRAGAPWVFSNEIAMRPEYRRLPPGGLVRLEADDGGRFGTFMFNPHSLIAARLLDRDPDAEIGVAWLRQRLAAAIALRGRLCDGVFHRLVHAEADRMPGLVIDRYDDVAVLAANTAGMELLTPLIVEALLALLPLRAIVGRNDSAARKLEGLPEGVTLLHGSDAATVVAEGGVRFPVDLLTGQKTGWFFDQRGNRDRVAGLASRIASPVLSGLSRATDLSGLGDAAEQGCEDAAPASRGARVLDVFCHTGAFGVRCAAAGADSVLLVDASAPALDLALQAAASNGVADRVTARRGDAFDIMTALAAEGERFDIVICDPPARPGCVPMAAWRGWRRRWWRRAGSCLSRRAAITRRWMRGRRRLPSDCTGRGGRGGSCVRRVRGRTIRCIRNCRRRRISRRSCCSCFDPPVHRVIAARPTA